MLNTSRYCLQCELQIYTYTKCIPYKLCAIYCIYIDMDICYNAHYAMHMTI